MCHPHCKVCEHLCNATIALLVLCRCYDLANPVAAYIHKALESEPGAPAHTHLPGLFHFSAKMGPLCLSSVIFSLPADRPMQQDTRAIRLMVPPCCLHTTPCFHTTPYPSHTACHGAHNSVCLQLCVKHLSPMMLLSSHVRCSPSPSCHSWLLPSPCRTPLAATQRHAPDPTGAVAQQGSD